MILIEMSTQPNQVTDRNVCPTKRYVLPKETIGITKVNQLTLKLRQYFPKGPI